MGHGYEAGGTAQSQPLDRLRRILPLPPGGVSRAIGFASGLAAAITLHMQVSHLPLVPAPHCFAWATIGRVPGLKGP